jgi:hypothetical protein
LFLAVSWAVYIRYFLTLLPPIPLLLFLLYTAIIEGINSFGTYWMGKIGFVL